MKQWYDRIYEFDYVQTKCVSTICTATIQLYKHTSWKSYRAPEGSGWNFINYSWRCPEHSYFRPERIRADSLKCNCHAVDFPESNHIVHYGKCSGKKEYYAVNPMGIISLGVCKECAEDIIEKTQWKIYDEYGNRHYGGLK